MLDDGAQHGVVGGQPGDAHPLALELARSPDLGTGDHRRQRSLDERADTDDVGAVLPGQAKVVDVDDRHVSAAAGQQLE